METILARIAEIAKEKANERFTSLAHIIDEIMLIDCHFVLKERKAPGVDNVTKAEYGNNLQQNISNLVNSMKRQAYKPQPVRRTYIPKPGTDEMRPLGIPAYEDKVAQLALSKILNAIYEADFLDCSFGFRPNLGCHDALKVLTHIIEKRAINYIVDADIKGFFNHVDHQWLMKFIGLRIADTNILRLIARFLKAGVMEEGVVSSTPEGTPQGGVVSPILANIYLHYALDLWFEKVVQKQCRGEAYMVRYCDDFVCCFQYEEEAKSFYGALIDRLGKFNLEIAEEKSKIIAFGRRANDNNCKRLGKGKAETFDFLGFTHCCSKSRKGWFRVKRKTSRKKYKASLLRCKEWLRQNRSMPILELMNKLKIKLYGYYRYYGISDNSYMLDKFRHEVRGMLFKWLNRRSQRRSFNWDKFALFEKKYPLPRPRIYVNIYNLKPNIGCNL